VLIATFPKAIRALIEVLLIDSPQKPRHRPLDNLVLERRHAYRPLTPILLVQPRPLDRRRHVSAALDAFVQIA
jgi:hypothetical protein